MKDQTIINQMRKIFFNKDNEPIPYLTKEELFNLIDCEDKIKEESLKMLLENGEIYENRISCFRWLG